MRKLLLGIVGLGVIGGAGWFFLGKKEEKGSEIEFRYSEVKKDRLVRSISATGLVVANTAVDVKSKAGGIVVRLAVDEGAVVKKGDLIARIDPEDTRALYDQVNADVRSATARTSQARSNLQLQSATTQADVQAAEVAIATAKVRLERAKIEYERQPAVSRNALAAAQASYENAISTKDRYEKVTSLQARRDVVGNLAQAGASLNAARADLARQEDLLSRGFVAQGVVDRSRSTMEAALAAKNTAQQRKDTIEVEIEATLRGESRNVERAKALLEQARAEMAQVDIARTNYDEAQRNVRNTEVALVRAKANLMQNALRQSDIVQAESAQVRNNVSLKNAKVQLDSTTVLAPRDGVVTQKYLEEGTIIPPGTSTFSQGTSLVQLSDVTQLFVECAVDEADISNVKVGQDVKVTADAYRGVPFSGVVTRINPAAKTEANITAIKVRVRVLPGFKAKIVPGMNATCEFITLEKKDVIVVPSQALKTENGKTVVRVKTSNPKKPETRVVEIGETGNDGAEIKSGLKVGEEVVTAEIDVAAMRDTQKKMQEAQQGGGLAGSNPGGPRRPAAGAAGGGGARPR